GVHDAAEGSGTWGADMGEEMTTAGPTRVVGACARPCRSCPWRADNVRYQYPNLADYAADTIPASRGPGGGPRRSVRGAGNDVRLPRRGVIDAAVRWVGGRGRCRPPAGPIVARPLG